MTGAGAIELIVDGSSVKAIYTDEFPFAALAAELTGGGTPEIRRASHVEPTADGRWTADMSPRGGPELGPYDTRGEALASEIDWLRRHLAGEA